MGQWTGGFGSITHIYIQHVPEATGDLTLLLTSIQFGCKFVASKVKQAGLINL